MKTVQKFFCLELETGGLIISWLTLIACNLAALSSVAVVLMAGIVSCDNLVNIFSKSGIRDCSTLKGIFIGIPIFFIVLCIGFGCIACLCIKGIKSRNHIQVKPMTILLAIGSVLSILYIFDLSSGTIVIGILCAVFDIYCFMAMYSLYIILREENERRKNKEYRPTTLQA